MALRLGFVGVGGIAQRHLNGAQAREDVEIVGHCDVDEARAKEVAAKFGGRAYTSPVELYDNEKPDAIVISTPPSAHGEIEEEACRRGIHFFVEKPVAVNMALAERVLRAAEASGVLTQVGYMYRKSAPIRQVQELLRGRALAMVQAHFYMPGLPGAPWYETMADSGGQLVEQATHMLDLGRFLAGDVRTVIGRTARVRDWTPPPGFQPQSGMRHFAEGFDIPDTTALILDYESGALGTLSCSIVPQGQWDVGFKVVAEGLLVTIDGPSARWTGDESGEATAAEDWPLAVLYEFLDCVIAGRQPSIPYVEGVKSLAVSLAGYESVARNAPVALADLLPQGVA
ncbi:MAG: Gfo/Idh/MocA family oxidoreductase [Armatimonadetes bacterium]|nr:Gfo/Idh/MocA family oxidoreductase [Armatimonadota bacterium]